jgi:hypothetical protein
MELCVLCVPVEKINGNSSRGIMQGPTSHEAPLKREDVKVSKRTPEVSPPPSRERSSEDREGFA